jgi:hypothetical protein
MGTASPEQVGAAVVRVIERNKVEVVVAPASLRLASHIGLVSPTIAVRAQSGATGQKAAQAIADGHSPEKR